MRFPYIGAIRHRLTAKLTIPFIVVLVGALALLGFVSIRSNRAAMGASLDKRAEILVTTLADAVADPLAMGEVDRVQHLVDRTKQTDPDVTYIAVLNAESKAVATTDPALKRVLLTRDDFERAMAQVSTFLSRPVPGSRDTFEVAAPIKLHGAVGVLRIGFSTRSVDSMARQLAWTIVAVGAVALVAGIAVYLMVARRVAEPLRAAAELAELASGNADLTRRLTVTSDDEVGRLSRALNTFLDNLQGLVQDIRGAATQVAARAASRRSAPPA